MSKSWFDINEDYRNSTTDWDKALKMGGWNDKWEEAYLAYTRKPAIRGRMTLRDAESREALKDILRQFYPALREKPKSKSQSSYGYGRFSDFASPSRAGRYYRKKRQSPGKRRSRRHARSRYTR